MSRPRIRTLKPECWQDEAIGSLTHTERLLWVGLITMADDQGRLRAPVNAINGHCFPWDNLPPGHPSDGALLCVASPEAALPYAEECMRD